MNKETENSYMCNGEIKTKIWNSNWERNGQKWMQGNTLEAIAVGGAQDGDLSWSDRYGDGKMWLDWVYMFK